jgi:hypothetical protein
VGGRLAGAEKVTTGAAVLTINDLERFLNLCFYGVVGAAVIAVVLWAYGRAARRSRKPRG